TTQLVARALHKGMTCLDIGANIGYYVLLERKIIGEDGKIIAIEPSPVNFRYLTNNLKLGNAENIEAYNIAAGDKNGEINFLIYEQASNSCMVIPEGQESRWPGKIIKVPVRTMDSFLEDLGVNKLDFLRMDVEGYELQIFEGMKNTIKKFKPIIQIEVHKSIMGNDNTRKFFQQLKNDGYDSHYYIPRDIDTPLIGTMKDVKNYNIDKLTEMLEDGTLPSFFILSLRIKSSS
ncbi:MAG: FkbM family methyltransferase, partial [Candidatus Paceibacterota bacterium]